MPAVIYVNDGHGLWLEVSVLRCRKIVYHGFPYYECLVRVDGKLKYVYKTA